MTTFVTNPCLLCRQPVLRANDVTMLQAHMDPGLGQAYAAPPQAQHFLPVTNQGVLVCQGTPQLAQYLEGQPRYEGNEPYDAGIETQVRNAYLRLLMGRGLGSAQADLF